MPESASVVFPALRDPKYPVHKIADALEPYLRAIVENVHPEKIILFGSQAYGEPTEHSDVDLLVVRSGIRSSKESNMEMRNLFWEVQAPSLPFTLLSRTPEELESKIAIGSPVYKDILDKGVLLYAA